MNFRALLTAAAVAVVPTLLTAQPPGSEQAAARLESSPRHGELVDIQLPGGQAALKTWVVYPERKDRAPAVIVIHEIYGLTDWLRGVADQLAADGFIALAPDLLSGKGPGGGGTESFASRDEVVQQIRGLDAAEVHAKLDAVRAYAIALPAASGKSATIGFCWGGSASFAYAAAQPELDAAVVYYGSAPEADKLAAIQAPVLGLYGGDDARVTSTVEPTDQEMQRLGKSYKHEIYEGAGHGFLRDQSGRDGANAKAAEQAWPRTLKFLRQHTGG
ncbi:MAG TPA: dienelactone hydrolase family protein [Acidobacteriota bacterium]